MGLIRYSTRQGALRIMPHSTSNTASKSLLPGILLNLAPFLLLCAVIVTVAEKENATARRLAYERVSAELADLQAIYGSTATDYGWWDEARDRIVNDRDTQWADENIHHWLARTTGLGAAFVFDPDGRTIYSTLPERMTPGDISRLVMSARSSSALENPLAATGFTMIDGRPMLMAASALRPMASQPEASYESVLLLAWSLEDVVIDRIRATTRIPSLGFSEAKADGFTINDVNGAPLLRLSWDPQRPGTYFIITVLPVAGAGMAILSALGWWYFIRARKHWRALVAAEESRMRLLAAIGHDLRQPLQSMALFSTILEAEVVSQRGVSALTFLRQGVDGMGDLLNTILELARLDMQQPGTVKLTPVPLETVVRHLIQELGEQADAKGLSLRHVRTTALVQSNPVLLTALIRNLLTNAIRYTNQGKILIGVRRSRNGPELWVCDTGIGIAADQQQLIFEEFYQIGNSARDTALGVGLGLSIIKRLAHLLDCHIHLSSQPGKGSVFAVRLKAAHQ